MSEVNDKFKVYVYSGGHFEYFNNNLTYMPLDCKIVMLKLPVAPERPISYKSLLKSVLRKSGLPLDSDICMKYMVDQLFLEITNDVDDLEEFWSHAINNAPIKIYIVDNRRNSSGRGSNQPGTSGSGGFQLQLQQYQSQYYQPPYPSPYSPSPYYRPPYQQYPHLNIQNTQFTIKEVTEANESTQETSVPNVEHYGAQNVNPQKTFEHPFDNDIFSDEETDECETWSKKRKDTFWNMPPLLQEDLPDSTKRPVTMYEPSCRVKEGQVFECKEELKLQLETKCLEEGFTTKIKNSDKIRYVVTCALNNCDWKLTARKILHTENFQVRKFVDVHTCSRSQLQANSRHANKKVLGHLLKELMTKE